MLPLLIGVLILLVGVLIGSSLTDNDNRDGATGITDVPGPGNQASQGDGSTPVTAVVITVTTPQGSVPVVITRPATTAGSVITEPDEGSNPFGGQAPEDKLMPDVVCMDLQAAQNEIQDHGVFFSRSEDASGQGRRQLWDRNWIVVDQKPAPGEPIGEGDALLFVVKDGEPNNCPE